MHTVFLALAVLLVTSLFSNTLSLTVRTQKFNPPPPEGLEYETIWGLASRTLTDPDGNSTAAGSCKRLLGPPNPESFKRKFCRADATMSWVPSLKTPRFVDVRFDPRPTILASRGVAVEIQVLFDGELQPAITSIDYVVTLPDSPGAIPLPIYTAEEGDTLECPAVNVFPIPPEVLSPIGDLSLDGALVLGVRIKTNDGLVERRNQMVSISAVGLRVLRDDDLATPPAGVE